MSEANSATRPHQGRHPVRLHWLALLTVLGPAVGCGTTRMTDTQRTATEMLLVSNAIDDVVEQLDLSALTGKTVFFDAQYLDGTVDKGYLISSLRQYLLANGCLLQEDRAKATYVIEVRAGGMGTDRHSLLVGIPQMTVPTFLPGQPSQVPEIPFAKKTDQQGVAKVALFAYNRQTGRALWQSGVVEAVSTARDTWVLGAGPFRRGTICKGTEFAGAQLPLPHFSDKEGGDDEHGIAAPHLTHAAAWREPAPPKIDDKQLPDVMALLGSRPLLGDWNRTGPDNRDKAASPSSDAEALTAARKNAQPELRSAPAVAVAQTPPLSLFTSPLPNPGGQAETEPSKVMISGWGFFQPDK